MGRPVLVYLSGISFTDRGRGQGFVLSEHRAASRTGRKDEHIKPYSIHTTCNGCMEGDLFGMCKNIIHAYKQIVN
jgi:hypothetical protein